MGYELSEAIQISPFQKPAPVFIIVCKNTRIAKLVYERMAEDRSPLDIPPAKIEDFRKRNGHANTIRMNSKFIHETDTGGAKSDESRWMRFILDEEISQVFSVPVEVNPFKANPQGPAKRRKVYR